MSVEFNTAFQALTGNPPFPWQAALYERFIADRPDNIPVSCNLPTGLGKTSVVAVWLIALATHPDKMPRRLVYVVNRRTVVDQTTVEVEKLCDRLHELPAIYWRLCELSAMPPAVPYRWEPLAISTLRGQYADNREWSADPSRPAVICGTVDMIGSRLLFSGYGVGFKGRPLHAGFLGQDALLVHDEAHLEPAFQDLLIAIEKEQRRCKDFGTFRVMELSATSRGGGDAFQLTPADHENATVRNRVYAKKAVHLHEAKDDKKLAEEIAALAKADHTKETAVVVFVRRVDDVDKIVGKLPKDSVEQLTGTLRGLERDDLVKKPVFQRFLPESNRVKGLTPQRGTVYLICTSAGEVGVNISADHLVCDLSTFDSMAQRFGRVNRFGGNDKTRIDIVHPAKLDEKDDPEGRRAKTLELLRQLNGDGSPAALGKLDSNARVAAFAPQPTILPTSDILFDAWALTTIRDKLPGRPKVEPYLHGLSGWEPPETHVAWREEVGVITGDLLKKYKPKDLLEDYPVQPHELLREPSHRAFKHLATLAERHRELPVWLLDDDGNVQILTLGNLADKDQKDRINGMTVLLPPSAGGWSGGRLDGSTRYEEEHKDHYDVADKWEGPDGGPMRRRTREDVKAAKGWRIVRSVNLGETEDGEPKEVWHWLVRRAATDEAGAVGQAGPYALDQHNTDAGEIAAEIVKRLDLPADLAAAVSVAAASHDLGKDRDVWQRSIGNGPPKQPRLAKSGHRRPPEVVTHYRHEFGSLLDVPGVTAFQKLSPDMQQVALHLIAAHHGRGRPHFPADEAFDPGHPQGDAQALAVEVPRRFARLQRKYGRWGLAYLESLVRAADVLASKKAEGGAS